MATVVLTNSKLYVAQFDFSGQFNSLGLNYDAEALDETVFGNDTRSNRAGLKTFSYDHRGFFDPNTGVDGIDEEMHGNVGLENVVMTIAPETGADGERAYSGEIVQTQYSPGGAVGELLQFSVTGAATDTPIPATIMHDALSAESATGNGTKRQLGDIDAGQKIYAAVHLTAATALTSLDIDIESDADASAGGETVRGSFTQLTGLGSEYILVHDGDASTISDTWWRVAWTLVGTDATFIVTIGIVGPETP